MKVALSLFFSISLSALFAQETLEDIDTTFDFKERFYLNEELSVQNTVLYRDSAHTYSIDQVNSNPNIDTSQLKQVKDGLWIEYFDKKWKECDSSEYHYFSLGEYDTGYYTGKVYYFNKKNEVVRTYLRYPEVSDSIFEGVRQIDYKKGKITQVEYHLFNQDRSPLFFWYSLQFNSSGTLISYSFRDEANNLTRFITYSDEGLILKDYKRDSIEWYDRKWNKKRTKLKEEVFLKNKKFIRIYRNGKLVKKK